MKKITSLALAIILSASVAWGSQRGSYVPDQDVSTTSDVTHSGVTVSHATAPQLMLYETGAAANNKKWIMQVFGEALRLRLLNDAGDSAASILEVQRTANTVDSITVPVFTVSGELNVGSIGKTTPTEGQFSPMVSRGPAAVTTLTTPAVTGTVTATASTTVTFSSAADAILAGYRATNPILGTTLISNALTRYIISWTNATTCVVDSSVTWAGTAITSVQWPEASWANASGTLTQFIRASGQPQSLQTLITTSISVSEGTITVNNAPATVSLSQVAASETNGVYNSLSNGGGNLRIGISNVSGTGQSIGEGVYGAFISKSGNYPLSLATNGAVRLQATGDGNLLLGGLTAAGTSAAKVLAGAEATAPTTFPANAAQLWPANKGGLDGNVGWHMANEAGQSGAVAFAPTTKTVSSTPVTLAATEIANYEVWVTTGASVINLPAGTAALDGSKVTFRSIAAVTFSVDPNGSQVVDLAGTSLTGGNKITSPGGNGDMVELQWDNTASKWRTKNMAGVFVDGGA
jgi:hypothetical protein